MILYCLYMILYDFDHNSYCNYYYQYYDYFGGGADIVRCVLRRMPTFVVIGPTGPIGQCGTHRALLDPGHMGPSGPVGPPLVPLVPLGPLGSMPTFVIICPHS